MTYNPTDATRDPFAVRRSGGGTRRSQPQPVEGGRPITVVVNGKPITISPGGASEGVGGVTPGREPSLDFNDPIPDSAVLIKGTPKRPYEQYTYGQLKEMGFLGPGATWNDYLQQTTLGSNLDEFLGSPGTGGGGAIPTDFGLDIAGGGGGGGRRGGGGAAAAVYAAPDRASVEENMRAYVIAVTGEQDQNIVKGAADAWLAADRANFNSASPTDPNVAAKSYVRGTAKYKDLHQLRDPSEDELDWVTSRQGKLRSLGLSSSRAAALGVQQARVGSDDAALQRAAEVTEVADTGRLLDSQRERLKAKGRAALGLI